MAPKRSIVWEHFERLDRETVLCRVCTKNLKCVNNTSNMRLHLRSKHPTLMCESSTIVSSEEGTLDNSTIEGDPAEPLQCSSTAAAGTSASVEVLPSTSTTGAGKRPSSVSDISRSTNTPGFNCPPKKRCRQLKLTTKPSILLIEKNFRLTELL